MSNELAHQLVICEIKLQFIHSIAFLQINLAPLQAINLRLE